MKNSAVDAHHTGNSSAGYSAYNWWNETLHGVARTPFNTTFYPQAIGMAVTWGHTSSMRLMGYYCAVEGAGQITKPLNSTKKVIFIWGLLYWTPNINIFRDPRWGAGRKPMAKTFTWPACWVMPCKGLVGTNINICRRQPVPNTLRCIAAPSLRASFR